MGKPICNEHQAFEYLKNILFLWRNNELSDSQERIDLFFKNLISSGWNRKRVYTFTFDFIKNNLTDSDYANISNDAFDYLSDIETSIIGHCSYNSILKFPDEPEGEAELIAYVRGNIWKNNENS